jgi:pimeloyl-ACP methyl ester carboxylesterase
MWLENMTSARPPPPPPEPLRCELLATIRAPTLAIATEHGMPYSRLIVERLAACVPGSRLVTMQGATHFVSYQSPELYNPIGLEFVAGH